MPLIFPGATRSKIVLIEGNMFQRLALLDILTLCQYNCIAFDTTQKAEAYLNSVAASLRTTSSTCRRKWRKAAQKSALENLLPVSGATSKSPSQCDSLDPTPSPPCVTSCPAIRNEQNYSTSFGPLSNTRANGKARPSYSILRGNPLHVLQCNDALNPPPSSCCSHAASGPAALGEDLTSDNEDRFVGGLVALSAKNEFSIRTHEAVASVAHCLSRLPHRPDVQECFGLQQSSVKRNLEVSADSSCGMTQRYDHMTSCDGRHDSFRSDASRTAYASSANNDCRESNYRKVSYSSPSPPFIGDPQALNYVEGLQDSMKNLSVHDLGMQQATTGLRGWKAKAVLQDTASEPPNEGFCLEEDLCRRRALGSYAVRQDGTMGLRNVRESVSQEPTTGNMRHGEVTKEQPTNGSRATKLVSDHHRATDRATEGYTAITSQGEKWEQEQEEDGLKIKPDENVELVLCDRNAPGMEDFGFLRFLHGSKDPWLASLPVVVIGASLDAATRATCLSLGARACLPKPLALPVIKTLFTFFNALSKRSSRKTRKKTLSDVGHTMSRSTLRSTTRVDLSGEADTQDTNENASQGLQESAASSASISQRAKEGPCLSSFPSHQSGTTAVAWRRVENEADDAKGRENDRQVNDEEDDVICVTSPANQECEEEREDRDALREDGRAKRSPGQRCTCSSGLLRCPVEPPSLTSDTAASSRPSTSASSPYCPPQRALRAQVVACVRPETHEVSSSRSEHSASVVAAGLSCSAPSSSSLSESPPACFSSHRHKECLLAAAGGLRAARTGLERQGIKGERRLGVRLPSECGPGYEAVLCPGQTEHGEAIERTRSPARELHEMRQALPRTEESVCRAQQAHHLDKLQLATVTDDVKGPAKCPSVVISLSSLRAPSRTLQLALCSRQEGGSESNFPCESSSLQDKSSLTESYQSSDIRTHPPAPLLRCFKLRSVPSLDFRAGERDDGRHEEDETQTFGAERDTGERLSDAGPFVWKRDQDKEKTPADNELIGCGVYHRESILEKAQTVDVEEKIACHQVPPFYAHDRMRNRHMSWFPTVSREGNLVDFRSQSSATSPSSCVRTHQPSISSSFEIEKTKFCAALFQDQVPRCERGRMLGVSLPSSLCSPPRLLTSERGPLHADRGSSACRVSLLYTRQGRDEEDMHFSLPSQPRCSDQKPPSCVSSLHTPTQGESSFVRSDNSVTDSEGRPSCWMPCGDDIAGRRLVSAALLARRAVSLLSPQSVRKHGEVRVSRQTQLDTVAARGAKAVSPPASPRSVQLPDETLHRPLGGCLRSWVVDAVERGDNGGTESESRREESRGLSGDAEGHEIPLEITHHRLGTETDERTEGSVDSEDHSEEGSDAEDASLSDEEGKGFRVYERVSTLDRGATSYVHLVKRLPDMKAFAHKEILLECMTPAEQDLAKNEVRVLKAVKDPPMIAYVDSWIEPGHSLNIIIEYAPGGSLQAYLERAKLSGAPVPTALVRKWTAQISVGLLALHDHHILHRDLKPSNIMLTEDLDIRLCDFGISRSLKCAHEMAETAVGTPFIMSPELCQGKPYNASCDLWALGVTMFEMLELRRPFRGDSLHSLFWAIQTEELSFGSSFDSHGLPSEGGGGTMAGTEACPVDDPITPNDETQTFPSRLANAPVSPVSASLPERLERENKKVEQEQDGNGYEDGRETQKRRDEERTGTRRDEERERRDQEGRFAVRTELKKLCQTLLQKEPTERPSALDLCTSPVLYGEVRNFLRVHRPSDASHFLRLLEAHRESKSRAVCRGSLFSTSSPRPSVAFRGEAFAERHRNGDLSLSHPGRLDSRSSARNAYGCTGASDMESQREQEVAQAAQEASRALGEASMCLPSVGWKGDTLRSGEETGGECETCLKEGRRDVINRPQSGTDTNGDAASSCVSKDHSLHSTGASIPSKRRRQEDTPTPRSGARELYVLEEEGDEEEEEEKGKEENKAEGEGTRNMRERRDAKAGEKGENVIHCSNQGQRKDAEAREAETGNQAQSHLSDEVGKKTSEEMFRDRRRGERPQGHSPLLLFDSDPLPAVFAGIPSLMSPELTCWSSVTRATEKSQQGTAAGSSDPVSCEDKDAVQNDLGRRDSVVEIEQDAVSPSPLAASSSSRSWPPSSPSSSSSSSFSSTSASSFLSTSCSSSSFSSSSLPHRCASCSVASAPSASLGGGALSSRLVSDEKRGCVTSSTFQTSCRGASPPGRQSCLIAADAMREAASGAGRRDAPLEHAEERQEEGTSGRASVPGGETTLRDETPKPGEKTLVKQQSAEDSGRGAEEGEALTATLRARAEHGCALGLPLGAFWPSALASLEDGKETESGGASHEQRERRAQGEREQAETENPPLHLDSQSDVRRDEKVGQNEDMHAVLGDVSSRWSENDSRDCGVEVQTRIGSSETKAFDGDSVRFQNNRVIAANAGDEGTTGTATYSRQDLSLTCRLTLPTPADVPGSCCSPPLSASFHLGCTSPPSASPLYETRSVFPPTEGSVSPLVRSQRACSNSTHPPPRPPLPVSASLHSSYPSLSSLLLLSLASSASLLSSSSSSASSVSSAVSSSISASLRSTPNPCRTSPSSPVASANAQASPRLSMPRHVPQLRRVKFSSCWGRVRRESLEKRVSKGVTFTKGGGAGVRARLLPVSLLHCHSRLASTVLDTPRTLRKAKVPRRPGFANVPTGTSFRAALPHTVEHGSRIWRRRFGPVKATRYRRGSRSRADGDGSEDEEQTTQGGGGSLEEAGEEPGRTRASTGKGEPPNERGDATESCPREHESALGERRREKDTRSRVKDARKALGSEDGGRGDGRRDAPESERFFEAAETARTMSSCVRDGRVGVERQTYLRLRRDPGEGTLALGASLAASAVAPRPAPGAPSFVFSSRSSSPFFVPSQFLRPFSPSSSGSAFACPRLLASAFHPQSPRADHATGAKQHETDRKETGDSGHSACTREAPSSLAVVPAPQGPFVASTASPAHGETICFPGGKDLEDRGESADGMGRGSHAYALHPSVPHAIQGGEIRVVNKGVELVKRRIEGALAGTSGDTKAKKADEMEREYSTATETDKVRRSPEDGGRERRRSTTGLDRGEFREVGLYDRGGSSASLVDSTQRRVPFALSSSASAASMDASAASLREELTDQESARLCAPRTTKGEEMYGNERGEEAITGVKVWCVDGDKGCEEGTGNTGQPPRLWVPGERQRFDGEEETPGNRGSLEAKGTHPEMLRSAQALERAAVLIRSIFPENPVFLPCFSKSRLSTSRRLSPLSTLRTCAATLEDQQGAMEDYGGHSACRRHNLSLSPSFSSPFSASFPRIVASSWASKRPHAAAEAPCVSGRSVLLLRRRTCASVERPGRRRYGLRMLTLCVVFFLLLCSLFAWILRNSLSPSCTLIGLAEPPMFSSRSVNLASLFATRLPSCKWQVSSSETFISLLPRVSASNLSSPSQRGAALTRRLLRRAKRMAEETKGILDLVVAFFSRIVCALRPPFPSALDSGEQRNMQRRESASMHSRVVSHVQGTDTRSAERQGKLSETLADEKKEGKITHAAETRRPDSGTDSFRIDGLCAFFLFISWGLCPRNRGEACHEGDREIQEEGCRGVETVKEEQHRRKGADYSTILDKLPGVQTPVVLDFLQAALHLSRPAATDVLIGLLESTVCQLSVATCGDDAWSSSLSQESSFPRLPSDMSLPSSSPRSSFALSPLSQTRPRVASASPPLCYSSASLLLSSSTSSTALPRYASPRLDSYKTFFSLSWTRREVPLNLQRKLLSRLCMRYSLRQQEDQKSLFSSLVLSTSGEASSASPRETPGVEEEKERGRKSVDAISESLLEAETGNEDKSAQERTETSKRREPEESRSRSQRPKEKSSDTACVTDDEPPTVPPVEFSIRLLEEYLAIFSPTGVTSPSSSCHASSSRSRPLSRKAFGHRRRVPSSLPVSSSSNQSSSGSANPVVRHLETTGKRGGTRRADDEKNQIHRRARISQFSLWRCPPETLGHDLPAIRAGDAFGAFEARLAALASLPAAALLCLSSEEKKAFFLNIAQLLRRHAALLSLCTSIRMTGASKNSVAEPSPVCASSPDSELSSKSAASASVSLGASRSCSPSSEAPLSAQASVVAAEKECDEGDRRLTSCALRDTPQLPPSTSSAKSLRKLLPSFLRSVLHPSWLSPLGGRVDSDVEKSGDQKSCLPWRTDRHRIGKGAADHGGVWAAACVLHGALEGRLQGIKRERVLHVVRENAGSLLLLFSPVLFFSTPPPTLTAAALALLALLLLRVGLSPPGSRETMRRLVGVGAPALGNSRGTRKRLTEEGHGDELCASGSGCRRHAACSRFRLKQLEAFQATDEETLRSLSGGSRRNIAPSYRIAGQDLSTSLILERLFLLPPDRAAESAHPGSVPQTPGSSSLAATPSWPRYDVRSLGNCARSVETQERAKEKDETAERERDTARREDATRDDKEEWGAQEASLDSCHRERPWVASVWNALAQRVVDPRVATFLHDFAPFCPLIIFYPSTCDGQLTALTRRLLRATVRLSPSSVTIPAYLTRYSQFSSPLPLFPSVPGGPIHEPFASRCSSHLARCLSSASSDSFFPSPFSPPLSDDVKLFPSRLSTPLFRGTSHRMRLSTGKPLRTTSSTVENFFFWTSAFPRSRSTSFGSAASQVFPLIPQTGETQRTVRSSVCASTRVPTPGKEPRTRGLSEESPDSDEEIGEKWVRCGEVLLGNSANEDAVEKTGLFLNEGTEARSCGTCDKCTKCRWRDNETVSQSACSRRCCQKFVSWSLRVKQRKRKQRRDNRNGWSLYRMGLRGCSAATLRIESGAQDLSEDKKGDGNGMWIRGRGIKRGGENCRVCRAVPDSTRRGKRDREDAEEELGLLGWILRHIGDPVSPAVPQNLIINAVRGTLAWSVYEDNALIE
ncbi:NEK kinase [Toxoplasma gondii GT1]|uniref:non-specific serine/threonine protein kinase n=1 Tax=Toxoplasma gondii (strain ATCC 50853 / GT1) TaxID=507601 RepID=S7W4M5_TOXGG|nr:NEK kinase [Toxoplasma gondii GT1]